MEALSLAAEVWGLCTSNLSPADCPHCGTFHRSLRTACTLLWSQPSWKMHKVCSAGMELEDGESPSLGAVSILSTLFQSSVSRATWQTLGWSDSLLRLLMFTSQSNLSRNPDLLIHSVISKEWSVPRWWWKSNFIVVSISGYILLIGKIHLIFSCSHPMFVPPSLFLCSASRLL